ncbi:helix-turn-helix domain-containing protein [Actinobacillus lignieresii]|uniref:AraC family transcriptional regulator n=1 Tax=Actinobacillus lignieresii TaxID=720 RepID=A0A380U3I3_ACTLI|nr:AraC family transcriptional regulator [Actinobacillus lignieresii]SUT95822.1 AraC family transcriptional regulator [Actinobacillus lignieresii]
MDIIDHLIQLAQIQGEIHTHCLFQDHWRVENPKNAARPQGAFHILLQGECELWFEEQCFLLQAGDIFFLPKGQLHRLQNRGFRAELANPPCILERSSAYQTVANGDGEAKVEMFCGEFLYNPPATIIENLPDYLHFSLKNTPLTALISLFKTEAEKARFAHYSVINGLSQVLFSYILRIYLADNPNTIGILTALQDKRLSACLQAILLAPEKPWQVPTLAELANMSRANFLRVFQQKIGVSPTKLLMQIRLQQAALLLKQTQGNVLNIALSVGYQSEAHFSKAFKAVYGMPPSVWRKTG